MRWLRQRLEPDERILKPTWSYQIILLSFLVSWLGAFTSSQVIAQANTTRKGSKRLLWLSVAALTFGWQTVWSLHFLATIAETFDVEIQVDPFLTIISAIVATVFTFAALTSDGLGSREGWLYTLRKSYAFRWTRKRVNRHFRGLMGGKKREALRQRQMQAGQGGTDDDDEEDDFDDGDHARSAEEGLLSRHDGEDATSSGDGTLSRTTSEHDGEVQSENGVAGGGPTGRKNADFWEETATRNEALERGRKLLGDVPIDQDTMRMAGLGDDEDELDDEIPAVISTRNIPSAVKGTDSPRLRSGERSRHGRQNPGGVTFSTPPSHSEPNGSPSPPTHVPPAHHTTAGEAHPRRPSMVPSSAGTTTMTTNSRRSSTTSNSFGSDTTSSENVGLGTEMNIALSRVAKRRLISGAYRDGLSFKAFILEIYHGFSKFIAVKGILWGAAIVFMHHLGILALQIPQGRVIWNPVSVVFSCVVAWIVTCVAAICIRHMEVHFARQMLFSTIAALGVFFFHYSSVFFGATFVSSAPPSPNGGSYPSSIPFTITALAILTCVLASGMLAQNATVSRNRLAELILTKRRMWRVMAEKEAVDRASELKQSFISVASHELRTPLFSVTGYVELLARTQLSEEQVRRPPTGIFESSTRADESVWSGYVPRECTAGVSEHGAHHFERAGLRASSASPGSGYAR